jgi:glycosyltransferase involved in cell wall biosynthesis
VLSPVAVSVRSDPDWALSYYASLVPSVSRAASRARLGRTVVWSFAPEHTACARALRGELIVYQAADEPAAMSRNPARTAELEREHIGLSDLVFVASDALLEARRALGNVHRLPNAADRRHYAAVLTGDANATVEELLRAVRSPRVVPGVFGRLRRPVVMYGGAAYSWFDSDLFLEVARLRPGISFLLVGPLSGELAAGRLPDNVVTVGRRSYDEFVWYVASADVGIIPFRKGEWSRNCDPIVQYEFLLCGKPVVATSFPSALEHGSMVRTAGDARAFAREIDRALESDRADESVRARAAFGFGSTWEDRAAAALRLVGEHLEARAHATGEDA